MVFASLVTILFVVSFAINVYGGEVCFSERDARALLVEVSERRELQELVKEQEKLIENLKEQNRLLMEQISLLREVESLRRKQVDLYKISYEEERRKVRFSFIDKGKWFGIGVISGLVLFSVIF